MKLLQAAVNEGEPVFRGKALQESKHEAVNEPVNMQINDPNLLLRVSSRSPNRLQHP